MYICTRTTGFSIVLPENLFILDLVHGLLFSLIFDSLNSRNMKKKGDNELLVVLPVPH